MHFFVQKTKKMQFPPGNKPFGQDFRRETNPLARKTRKNWFLALENDEKCIVGFEKRRIMHFLFWKTRKMHFPLGNEPFGKKNKEKCIFGIGKLGKMHFGFEKQCGPPRCLILRFHWKLTLEAYVFRVDVFASDFTSVFWRSAWGEYCSWLRPDVACRKAPPRDRQFKATKNKAGFYTMCFVLCCPC